LLEGDGIDVDVNVCSGAHLALSNPSATRAHTMANGHAMVSQQFAIEQGARLEWLPGMLIPQRDAELRQQSAFRVAQGGGLLAIEMIAPGRVAHRETFDFRHLRLGCDIVVSDVLTVRERNSLTPASALEAGWKRFPKGCVATIYAVDPAIEKRLATNIMGFHSIECWVGASIVAQSNLLAVRILSDSMRSCRRLTAMIRKEILASCGWPISEARNASDDSYGQRD
jgi:urease accessory protein UreH